MDWPAILEDVEQRLFPSLGLDVWERCVYYKLLVSTRMQGRDTSDFALLPLARSVGISESKARSAIRRLHDKGCVSIDDRSRQGHRIRVLLPEEAIGAPATNDPASTLPLEDMDFYTDRTYLPAILSRENQACFYCLRALSSTEAVLDHVVPAASRRDNSYKNIVAACHACNSLKQEQPAEAFLRDLYRRGLLSSEELAIRLATLQQLALGELVPTGFAKRAG